MMALNMHAEPSSQKHNGDYVLLFVFFVCCFFFGGGNIILVIYLFLFTYS